MKLTKGYSVADTLNLPKVENIMLLEFAVENNNCFSTELLKTIKKLEFSRKNFIDTAVTYVELKKDYPVCLVQGRVTLDYENDSKMSFVSAKIDEKDDVIMSVKCNDCENIEGSCKHCYCFLSWLIKRTADPERPTRYFWSPPDPVEVTGIIMAKDLGKPMPAQTLPDNPHVLKDFLAQCKRRKLRNSLVLMYNNDDDEE